MEWNLIEKYIDEHGSAKNRAEIIAMLREYVAKLEREKSDIQNSFNKLEADHSTLLQANSQLTKELSRLTDWESQKARYHIEKLAPGVFAYQANPVGNGEQPVAHPEQLFCCHCFDSLQILSTLQKGNGSLYVCPNCKNESHYEVPQGVIGRSGKISDPYAKYRNPLG